MFRRNRTAASRASNRLNLFGRRNWPNLLKLESRIAPATITVTNNTDVVGAADGISIREALDSFNAGANTSDVTSTGIYGTSDTLLFGSITSPITLATGQLLYSKAGVALTITGPGAGALTIQNTMAGNRVLQITGGNVTMSGLKLTGGDATAAGGGINFATQTLTLSDVVVDGNTTTGNGGGIGFTAGTLTTGNCTISNNTATYGGGVFTPSGKVNITSSTVSGNAADIGAGIYVDSGFTLNVTSSTLSGNTAQFDGGGIYTFGFGTTTVMTSTISDNRSSVTGGGGNGGGSGLSIYNGTVTISNSTVANNTADISAGGGARFTGGATANVRNSTFAFNVATVGAGGGISIGSGTTILSSTIVSDNVAASNPDVSGTVNTSNQSLIEDPTGVTITTGSAVNADPGLGGFPAGFDFHGGTTKNFLPTAGGPADGTGNNAFLVNVDQRGIVRPSGSGPEIGSVELPSPIPTATATSPQVVSAGGTAQIVTVVYTDTVGSALIDKLTLGLTLGVGDITVDGPGGFSVQPTIFGSYPNDLSSVTVTYTFTPPNNTVAGTWDNSDNGDYTIKMNVNQVYDKDNSVSPFPPNNPVSAGTIGTFNVAIPIIYFVDEISDVDNGLYGTYVPNTPGIQSLREAIDRANTDSSPSLIQFDPTVFAGTQTITQASELLIGEGVTIIGPAGGLILDATGAIRLFNIDVTTVGDAVSISNMTATQGAVVGGDGGGILNLDAALALTNFDVTDCTSDGLGGGISLSTSDASLILTDSNITGNKATGTGSTGGGINIDTGSDVTVSRSTISGNESGEDGGGIYFFVGGSLTMDNSTLSGNTSNTGGAATSGGGGAYLFGTTTIIRNSTISGNTAMGAGMYGGGIGIFSGTATILNSTIAFNEADYGGGIGGNAATINSTIVSNNTGTTGGPDVYGDINADFSLFGNTTDAIITGGNNQENLDPELTVALALNGAPAGSPLTHAITTTGKAYNKGADTAVLGTDQRGGTFGRVEFGQADIGAFEVQAVTVTSIKVNNVTGGQRSNVFSMVITFSESVTFSGAVVNAFTVARKNAPPSQTEQPGLNGLVNIAATPLAGPASVVTLTFLTAGANPIFGVANLGGASFPFNSLPDGTYDLNIDAGQITGSEGGLDGNTAIAGSEDFDQVGSTNTVNDPYGLFRLFGDITGDGSVAVNDFNQFKGAFSNGPNAAFDYDNDGDVAIIDFNEFKKRNGSSLP